MQDPYTTYDERDIPDLETFEALHRELYAFPGWFLQQGQKSIGAWRMEMKKSLDLTRKGLEISDVDFLRFFPGLTDLTIRSSRIHSMHGLDGAKQLSFLFLCDMEIDSLSPIAKCGQLSHLCMENVKVVDNDFSCLATLGKLTNLEIRHCGLTDVEWLESLGSLVVAGFDENDIQDFSVVRSLPRLKIISTDFGFFEPPFEKLA